MNPPRMKCPTCGAWVMLRNGGAETHTAPGWYAATCPGSGARPQLRLVTADRATM